MKTGNLARISLAVIFLLTLVFIAVKPVQAAEIDRDGKVAADEVIDDDLYITSEIIQMDGTVNGLLMAAGDTVTITGLVNGDAIIAARKIRITETAVIRGNLFTMAGNVYMQGKLSGSLLGGSATLALLSGSSIGGSLYYAGYSLSTAAATQIEKDVFAADYQTILKGTINRDATISAGAIDFSGAIMRNAKFDVGSPYTTERPITYFGNIEMPETIQPGLRISPHAIIGGNLVYTSPQEQSSAIQSTPAGELIYRTPVPQDKSADEVEFPAYRTTYRGFFNYHPLNAAARFLSLFILGALILWLIPSFFPRTTDELKKNPGAAFGFGLLAIILAFPVCFIAACLIGVVGLLISMVSLFGLTFPIFGLGYAALGLATVLFLVVVFYGSHLVISYWLGDLIMVKISPALSPNAHRFLSLLMGVFIVGLAESIPVLGFMISLVCVLAGTGVFLFLFPRRKAVVVLPPAPGA